MNRFTEPCNDEPDFEQQQEMADIRADHLRDADMFKDRIPCPAATDWQLYSSAAQLLTEQQQQNQTQTYEPS